MRRIDAVVVAVPARNEEQRLPAALDAIALAAARSPVPVTVVVAADACTDGTAAVAEAHGVVVVTSTAARVGGARRAAVAAGLAAVGHDRVWIASTDADSLVPEDWLVVHLEHAEQGADVLRGAVRPDPRELEPTLVRRWRSRNPPTDVHEHVHGANLGVTAEAYLAVGGFEDVPLHEDVRLVRAAEAAGRLVVSTGRAPVVTSARLTGRAEGGFAAYLREQVLEG